MSFKRLVVKMTPATIVNYSTVDFSSKNDMEITIMRWNNEQKSKYLPELKKKGMIRHAMLRIWNKEGVYRLGFIFEYRDEKAYKECQPIWQEIERLNPETPAKIFANRGIVLDNNVLSD